MDASKTKTAPSTEQTDEAKGQKAASSYESANSIEAAIQEMPEEELLYELADLYKIFSDTTRIKILYTLMGGALCVADIAQAVNATHSAVSHQLRILKQARLVKFQRDGKNMMYSLSDEHIYTILAQGMSHVCE